MTVLHDGMSYHKELSETYRSTIARYVNGNESYALLDFPHHHNVGDSAIFLGEMDFLVEKFGRLPAYICDTNADIDVIAEKVQDIDLIFLHGGGNFGDLYYGPHYLRLQVIKKLQDKKIIQLPQTVFFQNVENALAISEAIEAHPDFTLLLRDEESRAFANSRFSCENALCPDAAHLLFGSLFAKRPKVDFAFLMRQDIERLDLNPGWLSGSESISGDWPVIERRSLSRRMLLKYVYLVDRSEDKLRATYMDYLLWAKERVESGLNFIGKGQVVVSDRLHGNILAGLIGRPHIAFDNNYGKLSNYFGSWGEPPGMYFCRSADDMPAALSAVRE